MSYKEAQVISQRRRAAGKAIDNRSMLEEVQDRDNMVKKLQQKKRKKKNDNSTMELTLNDQIKIGQKTQSINSETQPISSPTNHPSETKIEEAKLRKPVPYVRVTDYEQMKRNAGLL